MKQVPEISIHAYHRGLKKVNLRDEANYVTFRIKVGNMVNYMVLPKKIYDESRDEEKLTKRWAELPEAI